MNKTIQIPNTTRKKIHYRVESNLPCVRGAEYITVLPGKSVEYSVNVLPAKRGSCKGVITFVAGENPNK